MERLEYQRYCVSKTTGTVYNCGSADDPAHLRATFGDRVLNCDMRHETDRLGQHVRPQLQFDMTLAPWPVADDSADAVVAGDVLEHLTDEEIAVVLSEARRVARALCITVPHDDRPWADRSLGRLPPGDYDWYDKYLPDLGAAPKPRPHINLIDRAKLERLLAAAGWVCEDFREVPYGFVPLGFLVLARRAEVVS